MLQFLLKEFKKLNVLGTDSLDFLHNNNIFSLPARDRWCFILSSQRNFHNMA
jgi:hypothetical protein